MALAPDTQFVVSIAEGVSVIIGAVSFAFYSGKMAHTLETLKDTIEKHEESNERNSATLAAHGERISRLEGGQK